MKSLAGAKLIATTLESSFRSPSAIVLAALLVVLPVSSHAASDKSIRMSIAAAPRAAAVSAPSLEPPVAMSVHAGATSDQAVYATDADGDPLTFSLSEGPSYMTVTTTDPGTGSGSGNIHLAPSLLDTGRRTGGVGVYDGLFYRAASFGITVFPVLDPPADMTVNEGSTADQTLIGSDAEGYALTFTLVSGPLFATLTPTSDRTASLHLAPGGFDSGYYGAIVSITDGVADCRASFRILVNNVNFPPVLAQPADMHAIPNTLTDQILSASDADLQDLTFSKVDGPGYMTVDWLSLYPPRGYVRLAPSVADTGIALATVSISDGAASDQGSFLIRVDLDDRPPILALQDIDMLEGTDLDQTIVAFDPDGQRLSLSTGNLPRFMTVLAQTQPIGSDSVVSRIRLTPNHEDAGVYSVAFHVSDGWDEVTDTLHVTVREAGSAETSLRLGVTSGTEGALEYEYSSVDGVYRVSLRELLAFEFVATSGSGAHWTVLFVCPLVEGEYTTEGGLAGFSITGYDTTAPGLGSCYAATRFQIRKITRHIDGSIASFWATFQQGCWDGFHGELRYQVPGIPITLVAPRWLPAASNERVAFDVTAIDSARDAIALSVSGLPPGASFVDSGSGRAAFSWTPSRLQEGNYLVRFIATSAGGLADTALTTVHLVSTDRRPRASANGPYRGTVGMPTRFDSSGSEDPDGDDLSYHWTFGDGRAADGPAPLHAYAAPGPYPVALIVTDGLLEAGDQTLARIYWPDSARAFAVPSVSQLPPEPVRLQAGAGRFCVATEIVDSPSSLVDIDRSSFRIETKGLGSTDVIFADTTTFALGDVDGNGIPDAMACFDREGLRRLFDKISGRLSVAVSVEFSLTNGHVFTASLPMDILAPDVGLSVLMAPNPLHPIGMLSFVTTRVGAARLSLFDARGRRVRTLLDTGWLPTGYHDIPIDARGANGSGLASGVYFYRLETPEGARTGRIAIVR